MPLTVTFTINNPENPARAEVVNPRFEGTPANAAIDSKDLYKVIYSEAMGDYRYFGTLRGAVAWAPALALGSISAVVLDESEVSEIFVWGSIVIFILIYLANHYLQIEQLKRRLVARKAERLMVAPDGVLKTYPELVEASVPGVKDARSKLRPDGPSVLLAAFLIAVGAFVYFTIDESTAVHKPDDARTGENMENQLPRPQPQLPAPANESPN